MRRNIILTTMLLLINMLLMGQKQESNTNVMSYEYYRQRVLEYNQEIKKSREMTASYEAAVKKIKTGFYPTLDATANASYNFINKSFDLGGSATPMKNYNYQIGAGITQNVYSGSAVRNNWLAAKIQTEMAKLGEQLTIDNIVYMADVTYWTAVAQHEGYLSMIDYDSIVNSLYNVVKLRFEDGYVSKTDLLMVETRKIEGEFMLNNIKKSYLTSVQNLNILMGIEVNNKVIFTDSIATNIPIPRIMPLDSVLQTRPDYVISDKQIELQERYTKASLSKFLPQIAIGVDGNWGTPSFNIDGVGQFNAIAYGQVRIPIFNWLERQHTKRQNEAITRSFIQDKELLKDNINQELNNSITELLESYEMVKIAKMSFDISTQNLDLNTLSYNEGKLPIIDVLSSQLSWLSSYKNLIDANYNYKVSYAAYIKAIGGLR